MKRNAAIAGVKVVGDRGPERAGVVGVPARLVKDQNAVAQLEALFKVVQKRLKAYPSIELVRPPDAELTDLMIDLGCLDIDAECLTMVGRKQLVDRVFYAQVDAADGDAFALIVRVINVTKGVAERDRKVDDPPAKMSP